MRGDGSRECNSNKGYQKQIGIEVFDESITRSWGVRKEKGNDLCKGYRRGRISFACKSSGDCRSKVK